MIREMLGWVIAIGLTLLIGTVCWMAAAALISYSIQRYFELKEEFQFRMIEKGIAVDTVSEQVNQVN